MANMTVLQWRDSANAFLEPEKELKELLSAWALRNTGKWDLHPFSEYLAERIEPIAEIIAREFQKARMSVETDEITLLIAFS